MNNIPIVFTFDDNYTLPAGIAIKSLINAGKSDTWYEIYCLYNNLSEENRNKLNRIAKINWIKVDENMFHSVPVTTEYPVDVYYRLAIHDILPQYDKIIYSDVDVLFHDDLLEVYNTPLDGKYWAGVPLEKNELPSKETIAAQKGKPEDPTYMSGHTKFPENKNEFIFASGFMVINAKKMREDNMTKKFLAIAKKFGKKIKMFDLDVLNLACQYNTIKRLSFEYCVLEDIAIAKDFRKTNLYPFLSKVFSDKEIIRGIINPSISHYTGSDPVRVWDRDGEIQPNQYKIFFDMVPAPLLKKHEEVKELLFSKQDRILVLAPHPDDESIGCGGLLLKYRDQCDVVVLTDGRYGGLQNQDENDVVLLRKEEFKKVMEKLQITNYSFLNIEDGKLSENFEIFSKINFDNYDIIICPSQGESHIDHSSVYKFLAKINPKAKIFSYEVWSTIANPTHFIDISDSMSKKQELIQLYSSQVIQLDYISKITGLNCYRGMTVYPAVSYAEIYQEV